MIDINELMDQTALDCDTTMVPIDKVVELTKEYDAIINRLLKVVHQHYHGPNHKTIDTIASTDLNRNDIYLLDYENIGNFPALMRTWNQPNVQVYCFMNKQLIAHFDQQLQMIDPALQAKIHPIVLSTGGINALDIGIAMFVGYISASFHPNGIYIYTNDKGYHVLLEICRFWGIDNVEIRLSVASKETSVKPMVKSESKLVKPEPAVKSDYGFTIGQPLHIATKKKKLETKLDECKTFLQLINDQYPLERPIKRTEFDEYVSSLFPNTDLATITKLVNRCIGFRLLNAKKGKITLIKEIDRKH